MIAHSSQDQVLGSDLGLFNDFRPYVTADGLAACGVWSLVTDQGSGYGRVQAPPDSVAPVWPLPRSPACTQTLPSTHSVASSCPHSGHVISDQGQSGCSESSLVRIIQIQSIPQPREKRILDDQDLCHYLN